MEMRAAQLLKDVRFHNPRLAKVGVEAMSLAQLRERAGATLGPPERIEFLELLLVDSGRGTHSVDFTDHQLQPGTVVLVRPGQVQQWRLTQSLQGRVVLVSADVLAPTIARGQLDMKLLALDEWPTSSRPDRALFTHVLSDVTRMQADIGRFVGTDLEASIIWHQWMTVLLRLARDRTDSLPAAAMGSEAQVVRLFLRELERSLHKRPGVRELALRLGYSESTLSRACLAACGRTAKRVIDERIALEAKRLLAHSDTPAAEIGHRLGFSEPTNFVKFFRRTAALTPLEFRRRSRA